MKYNRTVSRAALVPLVNDRSARSDRADKHLKLIPKVGPNTNSLEKSKREGFGALAESSVPIYDQERHAHLNPQTLSLLHEAICNLCVKTVALALRVPIADLRAKTRCKAEIALARQLAMYLAHTTFGLAMADIGTHFRRDRTTVAHACMVVEDRRDVQTFDEMVCQLEAMLNEAHQIMSIHGLADPFEAAQECLTHGRHDV